jgi:hypothetical protein
VAARPGGRVVQLVFRALVLALPAGDPYRVAVDNPVTKRLLHHPDEDGNTVLDGRPATPVRDPGVNRPVDGTVRDEPDRQVAQTRRFHGLRT